MELREDVITRIVQQVVGDLKRSGSLPATPPAAGPKTAVKSGGQHGVFETMDEAIAAAGEGFRALNKLTLARRREIIQAIRQAGVDNARDFAERALAETGMGRVEDKIAKKRNASLMTPGVEDLEQQAWTGDHGLTVVERAPWGIVGAITPSTHPVATIINNAISIIAAGNSAVFNCHPGAKKSSTYGLQVLNQAIVKAGGPANLLTCVANPTMESGKTLFTHPQIRLLCVTGGPGVVKEAMRSGKKVIAAGPGNPPVVVDETADLDKAAQDIIAGATFDNNILCIAEKEVFVVDRVADQLKKCMQQHGGYELNAAQIEKLTQRVFKRDDKGHVLLARDLVGRDAAVLAQAIGLSVPSSVRLLFGETTNEHLFVQEEQMMPFMPIVRVPDVDTGIQLAVAAEHEYGHTAMMHSRNVVALHTMAKAVNTTIFVKNGASGAGLGIGGEGYISFSIASPTGDGIISARNFTRPRRCVLVDYFHIV